MKRHLPLFGLLLVLSCSEPKDEKEITITKFDQKIIDSLIPSDRTYTTYFIGIKGYTNDSIRIIPGKEGDGTYSFYFKDSIDSQLPFDYYGTDARYFTFDPYKATDGKIKIEYRLSGGY